MFIKCLNDQVEEEDIQSLFSQVAPSVKVLSIRLIRDDEGKKRGICFVDVENAEMAEQSLKLNNHNLKGSCI